jgi:endo-1,4-beta-mannosidase
VVNQKKERSDASTKKIMAMCINEIGVTYIKNQLKPIAFMLILDLVSILLPDSRKLNQNGLKNIIATHAAALIPAVS